MFDHCVSDKVRVDILPLCHKCQHALVLDDVFGKGGDNDKAGFRNEISWCYTGGRIPKVAYGRRHDTIYFYTKSNDWIYNYQAVMKPLNDKQKARYKYEDENGRYRLIGRFIKDSPIKGARDVPPEWEKTHPELVMRYYMKDGTFVFGLLERYSAVKSS